MSESERGGVHFPGNALGFSSRVVGEKMLTSSASGVHPGGGSFFAAAQAVTIVVSNEGVG